MIAIPVESASPVITSSKLFGNAPMFAMYDPIEEMFFVMQNGGEGNGGNTASFLIEQGVKTVLYTHLGEGVFNALDKASIDVYYLGKEPIAIAKIVNDLESGAYTKVDASNAKTYLDPGTATGECRCGCDDD